MNERIHQIAVELDDKRYEYGSLIQMSNGYFQLGDFSRALDLAKEALGIAIAVDKKGPDQQFV